MTKACVRWTPYDDATLLRLRDGDGLGFEEIAAELPGRTPAACAIRYYGKLKGAAGRTRRAKGPKPSAPAVSWRKRGASVAGVVAVPQPAAVVVVAPAAKASPAVERFRMPCLDHLRENAELQLRIDRQGLTAGFFGDPPPGRSALDERTRAAGAAAQQPSGRGGSDVG
jgi:hypothetical protein